MILEYVLFFIGAFLVSYFLHRFFYIKSKKHTFKKANVSGVRFRSQSKPVSGGITFFAMFIIAIIVYLFFFYDTGNSESTTIGIGIVVTLSFLMGLADDMINTSPYFKFFIQFLNGLILIKFGIYIDIFPYEYLNYVVTILWIVGIMNSVNMLDNMDAITTLISTTIIIGLGINFIYFHAELDHSLFFVIIATLAGLLSFLLFNWSPAKMYMGDNGSMVLGSLIGSLSIILLWNSNESDCICAIPKQITTVFLVFLIPITDTATVTINRLLKGKSPFVGGRDHTTHHLFYRFGSEKKVARILTIISLISVFLSVYITNFVEKLDDIIAVLLWIFAATVFLLLYINTRTTKPE